MDREGVMFKHVPMPAKSAINIGSGVCASPERKKQLGIV